MTCASNCVAVHQLQIRPHGERFIKPLNSSSVFTCEIQQFGDESADVAVRWLGKDRNEIKDVAGRLITSIDLFLSLTDSYWRPKPFFPGRSTMQAVSFFRQCTVSNILCIRQLEFNVVGFWLDLKWRLHVLCFTYSRRVYIERETSSLLKLYITSIRSEDDEYTCVGSIDGNKSEKTVLLQLFSKSSRIVCWKHCLRRTFHIMADYLQAVHQFACLSCALL